MIIVPSGVNSSNIVLAFSIHSSWMKLCESSLSLSITKPPSLQNVWYAYCHSSPSICSNSTKTRSLCANLQMSTGSFGTMRRRIIPANLGKSSRFRCSGNKGSCRGARRDHQRDAILSWGVAGGELETPVSTHQLSVCFAPYVVQHTRIHGEG